MSVHLRPKNDTLGRIGHAVSIDNVNNESSVETITAFAIVSVFTPYCNAITNGMAPHGPAATSSVISPHSEGTVVKPAKAKTSTGWKAIFAATTDQVAAPIGCIGLFARIIPNANSDVGGAAAPTKVAKVNSP